MPPGTLSGRPVAILFLKAPLVGAVKTRLAADIGTAARLALLLRDRADGSARGWPADPRNGILSLR